MPAHPYCIMLPIPLYQLHYCAVLRFGTRWAETPEQKHGR
jgi:hypothetical protein